MSREAMKLALAVLKEWRKGFPDDWTDFDTEAITALREALAEQPAQQEPVDRLLDEAKLLADDRPVEVGNLPEWALDAEHMIRRLVKAFNSASKPAQRKPLTLGQKQRLWSSVGDKPTLKDRVNAYGLAIEAAHGIKE